MEKICDKISKRILHPPPIPTLWIFRLENPSKTPLLHRRILTNFSRFWQKILFFWRELDLLENSLEGIRFLFFCAKTPLQSPKLTKNVETSHFSHSTDYSGKSIFHGIWPVKPPYRPKSVRLLGYLIFFS